MFTRTGILFRICEKCINLGEIKERFYALVGRRVPTEKILFRVCEKYLNLGEII
jgi:hypothetical protein